MNKISLSIVSLLCFANLSPGEELPKEVQLEPTTLDSWSQASGRAPVLQPSDPSRSSVNIAEWVRSTAGVNAAYRGADAGEPVIRGLGWERVTTQVGCHPLYGACPSRMDPPATYLDRESVESVTIVKGLPSVTLGPGGTGGRLILETDYDRGLDADPGFERYVETLWNEGRDGYLASAGTQGGTETTDLKLTLDRTDLGDYSSGGGVTVPAGREEAGISLSLGRRIGTQARLYSYAQFTREENVDYPSLPMDTESSESALFRLGYRVEPQGGALQRVELSGAVSTVDHVMNNKNKANRNRLEAETPSDALSLSGKAEVDLAGDDMMFTVGLDAERLEREAVRTRTMKMTGMTFTDRIWPKVERDNVGVYGEWNWDVQGPAAVRVGLRVDRSSGDARDADKRIVLGPGNSGTIRERYVQFNGPEAANVNRQETLPSGNLTFDWEPDEPWYAYVGVGHTERFPAATELYFAFFPAPGGFLVGNPSLEPEKKTEVNAGLGLKSGRLQGEFSVFAARVDEYILQTALRRDDFNGDGAPDTLRGFRNTDAELVGGELEGTLFLTDQLTLPFALAMVRGRNTSDDRDLPEIPPLSGAVDLRYEMDTPRSWWVETGLRFAARQDRIDEAFGEDETPSYTVAHVRGGVALTKSLQIEVGIENLFDEDYNEHLTREALLPAGDLNPGDEVPAPGRYGYVQLRAEF